MKKKILSVFAVCLMLFATAFAFIGCDENTATKNVYEQTQTFFTTVEDERTSDGMFVKNSSSDYNLSYYMELPNYNYYNKIFIIAINYLANNMEDLQRVEKINTLSDSDKSILNNYSQAIDRLASSYRTCFSNFQVYKNLCERMDLQLESHVVLEGAIAIFKDSLSEMLRDVYSSAMSLAQIKDTILNDFQILKSSNRPLDQNDTKALRDYFALTIANDYFKTLIVNLDMLGFTSGSSNSDVANLSKLYSTMVSQVNKLITLQNITSFKILTGEKEEELEKYNNTKVEQLFATFDSINNERKLFNRALDSFNLKEFYKNYSCNITSYKNKVYYAQQFYQEITSFHTSCLPQYIDFLTTNLGA